MIIPDNYSETFCTIWVLHMCRHSRLLREGAVVHRIIKVLWDTDLCGFFEITLNVFFHLSLSVCRCFLRNVGSDSCMHHAHYWLMSPFAMKRKNKQYHTSLLLQFAAGKISPNYWCACLLLLFNQLSPFQLSRLFKLLAIVQTDLVLSNLIGVCWATSLYTCWRGKS